jgi:gliding motility-associated lipoprotein GldH
MKTKVLALFILLIWSTTACDLHRTYESNHDFDQEGWHMNQQIDFDFQTNSPYPTTEILLRSDLNYPFYNLYLRAQLLDSLGKTLKEELLSINLYDPKTGEPLGAGNSIYQYSLKAFESNDFPYMGPYQIKLAQFMRLENLPGIISVGMRVEETVKSN